MGAWGYGLFQSDAELDLEVEISGIAARVAQDPAITLWRPEDPAHVVATLNAGLFHDLLTDFQFKKWNSGVVYLGALAMQLGVEIGGEDMQVLRETLAATSMYDEAKGQMEKGIQGYKGGEMWDFGSKGVIETMQAGASGEFRGFNVMEDYSKMPTPLSQLEEGKVEVGEVAKAGGGGKETGKDALGDKGKLKAWFAS